MTVNRQAAKLSLPVPRISSWTPRSGVKHTRRTAKDRSWYRAQWMALVNSTPEDSITELRKRLPEVHWWLKTNDRAWYMAHRPSSRQKQKPKNQIPLSFRSSKENPHEDTMTWDTKMATAVRASTQRIIGASGYPKRVTKRKIYVDLPELSKLKWRKASLPIQVLQEVVETPETFALRRIRWLAHKCQEERIQLKRKGFIRAINIDHVLHIPSVLHAFNEAMAIVSSIN